MKKEKRKVNLVGKNTLTISLPTQFVKDNNIEKGDELYTLFDNNEIIFSNSLKKPKKKEITINLDNFSYHSLSRYLGLLYMTNYTKIVLLHSNNQILNFKNDNMQDLNLTIKKILNRFIGAEIILQNQKQTTIECFLGHEDNDELEKIEKRVYFLLKDVLNELINSIENNTFDEFHKNSYDYHDNIDKFIYYFLRKLDFSNKSYDEKRVAYAFYSFLTTLVDKIRHLSEKINKYGSTNKIKDYLKEIFNLFIEQFILLHKAIILKEVIQKRYSLVKKIENEEFNTNELQILNEANIFLNTLNIFCEYSIIKGLDEGLIKYK